MTYQPRLNLEPLDALRAEADEIRHRLDGDAPLSWWRRDKLEERWRALTRYVAVAEERCGWTTGERIDPAPVDTRAVASETGDHRHHSGHPCTD